MIHHDRWVIQSLLYDQQVYEKIPPLPAWWFLYGMVAYVTMVSHAIGTHLHSAETVRAAREELAPSHPVRRILLPTEIDVMHAADRARYLLMTYDGPVQLAFPFTFDGLQTLVQECPRQRTKTELLRALLLLDPDECTVPYVRGLARWAHYFDGDVRKAMRGLPADVHVRRFLERVDPGTWYSHDALVEVVVYAYLRLVRHNSWSSADVVTVISDFVLLAPDLNAMTDRGAKDLLGMYMFTSNERRPLSETYTLSDLQQGSWVQKMNVSEMPIFHPSRIEVSVGS